jgi:hypothetical protein
MAAVDENREAPYADIFFLAFLETGKQNPILVGDSADETLR